MNKFYLTLSILVLLLFCRCKDFIEPNLKNENVNLLAPTDLLESNSYNQTFWWEENDNTVKHRFQLVSPSFLKTEKLILDTLIKGSRFNYTLEPGEYQWRVRAENGSSNGAYATRTLTIYSSTLSNQQVQTTLPANNTLTNQSTIPFQWLRLFGTKKYRIQIDQNSFVDPQRIVLDTTTAGLTFLLKDMNEGIYQWRIRAENDTESSKWTAINTFTYDKSPPPAVQLSSPTNNASVTVPLTLRWLALADAYKYELFVYKSDGIALWSGFPVTLTTNNYLFNLGTSGDKVFWKVRATDKAGNIGEFSETYNFKIQ